jgi:hypothetical protein
MRVVLIWGNLSRLMQPNDITDSLMADNILLSFPKTRNYCYP